MVLGPLTKSSGVSKVIKVHPQPAANNNAINCKVEDVAVSDIPPEDRASAIHVASLGIVAVIGGQYYGWNAAFATGFVPFFVSQILTGLAYVVYMSCTAEICGKIAFSGGSYGLSRVTLGYYCGYMVGFLELLEYIVCTSVSALFVGNFFTETYQWDSRYEPITWFIFYTVFVAFFSLRGRILWKLVIVFAIICLAPAVLYICGSIKYSNISRYGYYLDADNSTQVWLSGDLSSAYFAWLPYTSWAFAGIESLSLVTDMTSSPKVSIPYGMLGAVWALFISSIALIYIVPSLPPGIATTTQSHYFMNTGFYLGYGWSDEVGLWLILPAQVGMAAGFILPAGRLAQALADSSLLPPWLGLKNTSSNSLRRSMIFISTIGYFFCTICYFSSKFEQALQDFFILAATFCYIAQLVGFVLLRTTYKAESNGYQSPFGIIGAVYAGVIFFFMGISIAGGFQGDDGVAVIALLVFMTLLTIYYHVVCRNRQTISKDEYAAIFRFTIIKFNNLKRKAALKTHRKPERKPQLWSAIVSVLRTGSSGGVSAANKVSSYADILPNVPPPPRR